MWEETETRLVHIGVRKRNGRKLITSVEGLTEKECNAALKKLKSQLNCNGHIIKEEKCVTLEMQGDKREEINFFLINTANFSNNQIRVHGF